MNIETILTIPTKTISTILKNNKKIGKQNNDKKKPPKNSTAFDFITEIMKPIANIATVQIKDDAITKID